MNTIEKLTKFVNQRPGLDFANYGDYKSYNSEAREITKDRSDYFELLSLFLTRYKGLGDEALCQKLESSNDRLTLVNGELEYCTGQYFPTEYRPAANRVLANLIWRDYVKEYEELLGSDVLGTTIRKAIKGNVSRRVFKNYFL